MEKKVATFKKVASFTIIASFLVNATFSAARPFSTIYCTLTAARVQANVATFVKMLQPFCTNVATFSRCI